MLARLICLAPTGMKSIVRLETSCLKRSPRKIARNFS
jgi:hypothetical protein